MQAKELMQQVRRAEQELKLINAKKRHFIDLAASMGGGMGVASAKPSGASRVEAAAVGIVDLSTELDVKAKEYVALIHKAEALLSKLPQPRHREVLTLRYMSGWSWKSISDEMGYKDPKSVYRVHGWALQELQKLM
jgi:DNA-directed RNA polymerase specialized sigma24 family protein